MGTLVKVMSGGQPGVERIALEVAKEIGITTGGWAPPRFITRDGVDYTLRTMFNLSDMITPRASFNMSLLMQKLRNVEFASATVMIDIGERESRNIINRFEDDAFLVVLDSTREFTAVDMIAFIMVNRVVCLNILGSRKTLVTQAYKDRIRALLRNVFATVKHLSLTYEDLD